MEINITQFVKKADPTLYSNSVAKSGNPAIGKITWKRALNSKFSFVTKENKQDFIDYFDDFGAWDDLDKWSINKLNALFIQMVCGNLNEMYEVYDIYTWPEVERLQQDGQIASNIYKTDRNEFYYNLGI